MLRIADVLTSAKQVVEQSRFVRIDQRAAQAWADAQAPGDLETPAWPPELRFVGTPEACANLTLLLSSLNFCFWSDEPWSVNFRGRAWARTYAMFASVLRGVEEDAAWLTPQRWAAADDSTVAYLFRGHGEIPMLAKRREVLNETGRRLIDRFGGRFTSAVETAERQAPKLAGLLAECFPSFRDVAWHEGREVVFLKRAQICAADLHHAWCRCGHAGLIGMEELTVFADYRLPQYLRHVGVIRLEKNLADRIERRQELPAGSAEEVGLRAATIVASEIIRQALGGRVPAWQLDFVFWKRSHLPEVRIEHHRTRTVYY